MQGGDGELPPESHFSSLVLTCHVPVGASPLPSLEGRVWARDLGPALDWETTWTLAPECPDGATKGYMARAVIAREGLNGLS